jgi:hypothetical protein
MAEMSRSTTLKANPGVIAKRLDEVAVLVDVSTNRIFELNHTGARVWELMGEGFDSEQIVRRLVDEFDADLPIVAREVDSLLGRLRMEGLIAC